MVVTQTPLRLSFAGGGSDFPEFFHRHPGRVVSSTIDKYVYVLAMKRLYDDLIILHYSQREEVEKLEQVEHDLIRCCLARFNMKGVELHLQADLHLVGSGLGASSSVTVGVLNALYALHGIQVSADRLAKEACEIEIQECGRPIGWQDQYIAAFGGLCDIQFGTEHVTPSGCDMVTVERLGLSDQRLREIECSLLMFSLGVGHRGEEVLTEQRDRTRNEEHDATLLRLTQYADQAVRILRDEEPLSNLGDLLHKTWNLKKGLSSKINNDHIHKIYETAILAGAKGGKVCGAGGRGHIVFYVESNLQSSVIREVERIQGVQHLKFHLVPFGSRVIFNNQA